MNKDKNNLILKREYAIYVHIPFCQSKCHYCDFCSFANQNSFQKDYFKHLEKEINCRHIDGIVSSIFFGGGTPSFVDEKYIKSVLKSIKKKYDLADDIEISIECNPCVSLKKLQAYKDMGINRISFGVQSLNNKILKLINRFHNKKQAKNIVKSAREIGFENINVDLMLGLPEQKLKDVKKAINYFKNKCEHMSIYTLQLEKNTPLCKLVSEKVLTIPTDEKIAIYYEQATKILEKNGFFRYEISNFCKNEKFCRHNLSYWRRKEYLGFGLAASSFVDNERRVNSNEFDGYFKNLNIEREKLTKQQILTEILMLGLRCFEGVDLEILKKEKFDIKKNKYFKTYLQKKILIEKNNKIYLNPKFYEVSNSIISNLID